MNPLLSVYSAAVPPRLFQLPNCCCNNTGLYILVGLILIENSWWDYWLSLSWIILDLAQPGRAWPDKSENMFGAQCLSFPLIITIVCFTNWRSIIPKTGGRPYMPGQAGDPSRRNNGLRLMILIFAGWSWYWSSQEFQRREKRTPIIKNSSLSLFKRRPQRGHYGVFLMKIGWFLWLN